MKLHRYVDHQRLHIVTKDVISLSISVLLLFRHYISHKITFGAPSSGGVLCSACGAFFLFYFLLVLFSIILFKSFTCRCITTNVVLQLICHVCFFITFKQSDDNGFEHLIPSNVRCPVDLLHLLNVVDSGQSRCPTASAFLLLPG